MRSFYITILMSHLCCASFFDWLGWSDDAQSAGRVGVLFDNVPLMNIPFEELAPEEKFLVEASKITGLKLSQLDTCQHKLVMKLKTSCGALSEEELAKLSVNLLNCQSAVEGRPQYPCHENMSLKLCTKDMDAETWTAYHVVSNRARAVCYAVRQEQFRALSEMTVNKLMSTAHSHIASMSSLEGARKQMEHASLSAIDQVLRGQREAMRGQGALKASQSALAISVGQTLDALARERDIVVALRSNFTLLVESMRKKLIGAEAKVAKFTNERDLEHQRVMSDLKTLSEMASDIWTKIDDSTKAVLSHHETVTRQFESTLINLREINSSVDYISKLVADLRSHADEKLGYINSLIGENGEKLDCALSVTRHVAAMALCALLCSFLDVPRLFRWALIVSAPCNLYTTHFLPDYSHLSLPLKEFYAGLLGVAIVCWLVDFCVQKCLNRKPEAPLTKQDKPLADRVHNSPFTKVSEWLRGHKNTADTAPVPATPNGYQNYSRFNSPLFTGQDDEVSVASATNRQYRSLARNPPESVAGSTASTNKTLCSGLTKSGLRCRNAASAASGGVFCQRHLLQT